MLKRSCIVIVIALIIIFIPYFIGVLTIPILFNGLSHNYIAFWILGLISGFFITLIIALLIELIRFLFNYIIKNKL